MEKGIRVKPEYVMDRAQLQEAAPFAKAFDSLPGMIVVEAAE